MARPATLSDEALIAALGAHPEATAAEIAGVLGAGQSTVAKRLALLEATGAAHRTPGGRVDGVRAPDRWRTRGSATPQAEVTASSEAAGGASERPESEAPAGRLGRGALGAIVRDYLAARPTDAFGPAALGKALSRSQGAVSNALSAMAERGEVVLVQEHPRRYRIAR